MPQDTLSLWESISEIIFTIMTEQERVAHCTSGPAQCYNSSLMQQWGIYRSIRRQLL